MRLFRVVRLKLCLVSLVRSIDACPVFQLKWNRLDLFEMSEIPFFHVFQLALFRFLYTYLISLLQTILFGLFHANLTVLGPVLKLTFAL